MPIQYCVIHNRMSPVIHMHIINLATDGRDDSHGKAVILKLEGKKKKKKERLIVGKIPDPGPGLFVFKIF